MPNYFVKASDFNDGEIVITGNDFHHLVNVRRSSPGDELFLVDETGNRYSAVIKEIFSDSLLCSAESAERKQEGVQLWIYVSVLKGKKFDMAVQKAVEIGAAGIVPVLSERCVPDYGAKAGMKADRWRKIALEAAKQSMRSSVPEVSDPVAFDQAVSAASQERKIIAHLNGPDFREYACSGSRPASAAVLTGPEGGFSPEEIEKGERAGWKTVRFPFPQLRAETAAVVIPAMMIYEWSGECKNGNTSER